MVNNVVHSYRAYLAMEDTEAAKTAVPERIRFEVHDEEAAGAVSSSHRRNNDAASSRPALNRSSTAISEDSVHLRSASRRGSMTIEPSAGLPIQYRTL